MTMLLIYISKGLAQRIPAVLAGLMLDGLMVYTAYQIVLYHIDYFGL
jgi:hypothetical protein